MTRKLGEQLVSEGVLTHEQLARALQRQKETGQKLGECLVRLGLDETPVLRVLAQELKTRFVSTVKLAQARIEPGVIERVPVRLAEGFDFVPLRLDDASNVLYVAIAEPQRQRAIEEICRTVGVARVLPFVALRRSIRAAIRKHYYSDAQAFEHMRDDDVCPHCGAPVKPDDFQCARCELLLIRHPEDLPNQDNVSLVRALLSIPDRTPATGIPQPPHMDKTRAFSYAPDASAAALIPSISASLDIAEKPLNPFEAYVLSFVDGRTPLGDIARVTSLADVELRAIFESLTQRGVTRLDGDAPRKGASMPDAASARSAPPVPAEAPAPSRASTQPPAPTPAPPVPAPEPRRPAAPASSTPPSSKLPPPAASSGPARSEDPADSVLQRVVQLEKNGKIDEAVEVLEQGISKLRNPAPLYNRLGLILLNQRRDYGRSATLFQKAADLDPDNSIYMMNLYAVLSLKAEATNAGKKARR
jgi:type IV pilus assembly protein PilB